MDVLRDDMDEYKLHCKGHEKKRLAYDHYRVKMNNLNEALAKKIDKPVTSFATTAAGNDKDDKKRQRNQGKFETAESYYQQTKGDLLAKIDLIF